MKYLTPEEYKEYMGAMPDEQALELWQKASSRSKGYNVPVSSPLYNRHEKSRIEREAQDARYEEKAYREELISRGIFLQ